MNAYFTELLGPAIGPIAGMAAWAILAVFVLWVLWMLLRRFRSGLFVSNGSGRALPRLAVTDAVPVDSNRRLILVRRDNVEHLIMIGGPTDIVVEAGIGKPQSDRAEPNMNQSAQRMSNQSGQSTPIMEAAAPAQSQQRPANVAAREAVADAERGRLVRAAEPQLAERRSESQMMPAPVAPPPAASPPAVSPPVFSTPISPPAAPPVAQPPIVPPVSVQPAQTYAASSQPAPVATAAAPNAKPELDLDKLLDELRPNPLQDRS